MISLSGKHTLNALLALHRMPPGTYAGATSAHRIHAPSNYLGKLLQKIARAGIVEGRKGRNGGFRLSGAWQTVSLFDALRPIEHFESFKDCFLGKPKVHEDKSLPSARRLDPCQGSVPGVPQVNQALRSRWRKVAKAAKNAAHGTGRGAVPRRRYLMNDPRVRALLLFLLAITFGVLIFGGTIIHRDKPPIPSVVRAENGQVVFTSEDVKNGQKLYLSRGGQDMGTIWGHGSYLAPDWSADYLHRAGLYVGARLDGLAPDRAASFTQSDFDGLDEVQKAQIRAMVTRELKANRFDSSKNELAFTSNEAEAFALLQRYYTGLFRDGNGRMGLQPGIVRTDAEGHALASFFAWLAWAAGTNRPGQSITYTSNWPFDPLVGNAPMAGALIWSIVSVVLLILLLGLSIFLYARYMHEDQYGAKLVTVLPEPTPTFSQKATLAYFTVAMQPLMSAIGSCTRLRWLSAPSTMRSSDQDKKTPGTYFELLVGHLLALAFGVQPRNRIEVLTVEDGTTLPTDFIFDLGPSQLKFHVPVEDLRPAGRAARYWPSRARSPRTPNSPPRSTCWARTAKAGATPRSSRATVRSSTSAPPT